MNWNWPATAIAQSSYGRYISGTNPRYEPPLFTSLLIQGKKQNKVSLKRKQELIGMIPQGWASLVSFWSSRVVYLRLIWKKDRMCLPLSTIRECSAEVSCKGRSGKSGLR